jgi:adenosylhomocysteine nucleosidase
VTDLVSVGLAGSCNQGMEPGSVVEAHIVVDTMTGERFESSSKPVGMSREQILATSDEIASVAEKARLAATYGAIAVDMEAATVARLARANGIRFQAIKAISDGHDTELSHLSKFGGEHGSFRTGAFALYTAVRPWTWAGAIELGRNSARAIAGLEQDLKLTLARHKVG